VAPIPKLALGSDKTPLDFLLNVMRDAETPPHLRFKVASIVAPYFHPKRGQDRSAACEMVFDDPFGFVVDPAVAMALRDDMWRLYELQKRSRGQGGKGTFNSAITAGPFTAADVEEEKHAQRKVAQTKRTLKCPPRYGPLEAAKDERRRYTFFGTRISPPPYDLLAEEEDAEDAYLAARVGANRLSPEASGRARILGA
jgi:hypothetical protein